MTDLQNPTEATESLPEIQAGDSITSLTIPSPEVNVTAPEIVLAQPTKETLAQELKEFAESVGHDITKVYEWLINKL